MSGKIFIPFSREIYIQLANVLKEKNITPEELLESIGQRYVEKYKLCTKYPTKNEKRKDGNSTPLPKCDVELINFAKREGIPDHIINTLYEILKDIRNYSKDPLIKGKERNWTSKPNNFVSFRIQPRKKNIRIDIRELPSILLEKFTTIEFKKSRYPYIYFILDSENQKHDAANAIKESFKKQ